MVQPQRLHEIYIRENTPSWLRSSGRAMITPEKFIPPFDEFINGKSDLEWSEYEDLLFMPVLAHFLSQVPLFRGPPLVVLTEQVTERARLFPDLLKLLRQQNKSLPCDHLVGLSLDMEDVRDVNAYTLEAAQRAERVAHILKQDFSTLEKTSLIGAKLTDEEAVDIYLYSLLVSDKPLNLPRPTWAIEQAHLAMAHLDKQWNNGRPSSQPVRPKDDTYESQGPNTPEPDRFLFVILTQKSTGKNAELLRTNISNGSITIRSAGKWDEFVPSKSWNENFDFHAVDASPQQRAELIEIFDSQRHLTKDLSAYFMALDAPRKVERLTQADLENYLNAEVIFTDVNGISCTTAPVGAMKQVWPSLGAALGQDIGEVWVFRADVLLPHANNQSDDDITLTFFADEIATFGLITQHVQVKSLGGKLVPAIMVPVPRAKMSKNLATEIALTAIMSGRLGIYQFVDNKMTAFTSSAVGYTGKRSVQIVLAN